MGAMLLVLGAMGSVGAEGLTRVERDVMVTSLMLFSFFYNLSWAPV
jgi:SP family sugar:H+ symporter-like MFS transporter